MQIMQFTKDIRYEYDKFSLNYIIVGNFRTKLINQKIWKKYLDHYVLYTFITSIIWIFTSEHNYQTMFGSEIQHVCKISFLYVSNL